MAQNADDQVTDIGNQLEQLNDCLNDLEKELNECETIKEVSQVAVKFIREELKSQAAFIFLFDKDGLAKVFRADKFPILAMIGDLGFLNILLIYKITMEALQNISMENNI
jgi:hypothetical protein